MFIFAGLLMNPLSKFYLKLAAVSFLSTLTIPMGVVLFGYAPVFGPIFVAAGALNSVLDAAYCIKGIREIGKSRAIYGVTG